MEQLLADSKKYRIGEVAKLLRLRTSVLRFWEKEFPQLEPQRTEKGQRFYTDTHIELLKRIQRLLHERGMTIEGARRILAGGNDMEEKPQQKSSFGIDTAFMNRLTDELMAIRELLAGKAQ